MMFAANKTQNSGIPGPHPVGVNPHHPVSIDSHHPVSVNSHHPVSIDSQFMTSLVKSLHSLCNVAVDFNQTVELVGHINIKVDHNFKYDYVLDEKLLKSEVDASTDFLSSSYHSAPPSKSGGDELNKSASISADILCDDESRAFNNFGAMRTEEDSYAVRYEGLVGKQLTQSQNIIKEESGGGQQAASDCVMLSQPFDPGNGDLQTKLHGETMDSSSKRNPDNDGKQSETDLKASLRKEIDALENVKHVITKLVSLCDHTGMSGVEKGGEGAADKTQRIRLAKRTLLDNFNREKVKKMKEVLKTKRGKRRKIELKSLIGETGLSHEQLLLLAHNIPQSHRRINWKGIPEGPDKREMLREQRKALRNKTQERQEKLLEMAEMLKNNQLNEQGINILSKGGLRKCTLNKSSISVVSHNTQQLTMDNIDEAIDALTGKIKRGVIPYKRADKNEEFKMDHHKKHVVKRKVKQIIGKILNEVSESGYRAVFTNTVGSDAGSHSAELVILPLRVDEFLPENKETDVKSEMSENEYAKQLEREQFIEKQKANEEKMKELEEKLIRILTGTEEIYIPTRKRFAPGEIRPTDAERMKEFRKRLKEDPEKHQMLKQKQAMGRKLRSLSSLAGKVKTGASGNGQVLQPNGVNDVQQSVNPLAAINQPTVGNVSMHCNPQVYDPHDPQPPASAVNVHHSNQYVGQVAGMHAGHQQPMGYGNEMDIVELIAATHNVQNQHFG